MKILPAQVKRRECEPSRIRVIRLRLLGVDAVCTMKE